MNKIKLKKLSADDRRKLYIHYVMLFNDFYKERFIVHGIVCFRHYDQLKVRFKRLKSVMSQEEIQQITFTAG